MTFAFTFAKHPDATNLAKVMKNISAILIFALLGFLVYDRYLAPRPELDPLDPLPAPPSRPVAGPVDYADKASVRKLLEEWKNRSLGDPAGGHGVKGSPALNAGVEIREIRRRLFARGIYNPDAVNNVIESALREIGVKESEIPSLAASIATMH